ncbi:Holliday junction branch migration protein RuvA [Entomospira culicis]|uniref:Holliday junction branch migration complex subunit RuvA n=1 Tax=Entomospira culicis TaxID=2719989 RepID=A0A968KWL1_9SPIO|nr:Holliday junction branch migration protein RuvA [Entomospira culicis]NIZ19138.1 Holliday junction branch migration protein RuvA [Entomospira culicis]NIZ69352.1 Holliday junction branch migration protein RuvA [Entomospira culicis]WDI37937.1 Holliday junction branch migration protein RuvA [Entomospira culicis]WDI39565.1 Holliday junction branch migration protein RuvA [Entomospira culicis]
MIQSITGQITALDGESASLQMGAIEWQLSMSGQSLSQLKIGDEVKIYTYLHHKEDSMQLFGFKELMEREIFFQLIKVDGVGPKAALKILTFFTPKAFREALNAPDVKLLAKAPGLGTKTAQKVMLALKGKLDLSAESGENSGGKITYDELLQPLVGMGFDKKSASEILSSVRKDLGESASEAEILRKAITLLS